MPGAILYWLFEFQRIFYIFVVFYFCCPRLFSDSHIMRRNMKRDHVNESKKKSAALRADLVRRYEQFFFFYFSPEM